MNGQATQTVDVSVPDDLESARAKLVYVYLAVCGAASADDLCAALALEKGTALSITGTLRERGHLERCDGRYSLS